MMKQDPTLYSKIDENPEDMIYKWIDKNVEKEALTVNGPKDRAGP